jgi:hypothetical protein
MNPPLPIALADEERDESFIIRDATGQPLAYVYFEDDGGSLGDDRAACGTACRLFPFLRSQGWAAHSSSMACRRRWSPDAHNACWGSNPIAHGVERSGCPRKRLNSAAI